MKGVVGASGERYKLFAVVIGVISYWYYSIWIAGMTSLLRDCSLGLSWLLLLRVTSSGEAKWGPLGVRCLLWLVRDATTVGRFRLGCAKELGPWGLSRGDLMPWSRQLVWTPLLHECVSMHRHVFWRNTRQDGPCCARFASSVRRLITSASLVSRCGIGF